MNKNKIIITLSIIAFIALFVWSNETRKGTIIPFGNTDIACLPNGHVNLTDHVHPELTITVDGVKEVIPANVGIVPNCMSEIHTHDETGVIHAESYIPGRVQDMTLADFYAVWDKNPQREGYALEIFQDGELKNSIEEVKIIDLSKIELRYTSIQE